MSDFQNMIEGYPEFVNKTNLKNYNNNLKLIGQLFNRLELKAIVGIKNRVFIGSFSCTCGNVVEKSISSVVKGYVKSCGCLQKEVVAGLAKHNLTGSDIYMRWASMKYRCKDLNDPVYGGKGITYDPSWEDFEQFYADMHEGFSPELEIDRIDVTKGYSKENCRWVTHCENNFNKNIQSNNSTGKTGVSFHKPTGKYRAYITVEKKPIHLGLFDSVEEATKRRREAELKYYGYNRP